MEYIHKAKAEKTRTKVLTDQMEARRTKNKVRLIILRDVFFCRSYACTGCSRTSCCSCSREAPGDHRGRARDREGVNRLVSFVSSVVSSHLLLCVYYAVRACSSMSSSRRNPSSHVCIPCLIISLRVQSDIVKDVKCHIWHLVGVSDVHIQPHCFVVTVDLLYLSLPSRTHFCYHLR
jgi:hypothetical protein